MRERLGIVTNCLAKRLECGDSFEELILSFGRSGFGHIEIRDGAYLRGSEFGRFIDGVEAVMDGFSGAQWKDLCRRLRDPGSAWAEAVPARDRPLCARLNRWLTASGHLVLSYAMAHPWLSLPADRAADTDGVGRAKKLAYLLNPAGARLRLVDLNGAQPGGVASAADNLKRYRALLPELPVTLAVENALLPADVILALAVQGGAMLAYDEANCYRDDGSLLGPQEVFWSALQVTQIASVHLKQKAAQGVPARLGDGFVDIPALLSRLAERRYTGDLLFEYTATDQPLEDALASRRTLSDQVDRLKAQGFLT